MASNPTNPSKSDKTLIIRTGDSESLRQRVFALLDKDHELKPKNICKLLDQSYYEKGSTIGNYCSQWRSNYRKQLGPNCLSFHKSHGWLFGFRELMAVRDRAVGAGWVLSRARNRGLFWVDAQRLGRLEWFGNGRINVFVRKPVSDARLKQLLANAFMWTGLISDVHLFEAWVKTYRKKGAHVAIDLGQRLPYSCVDFLKESNGVVVKTGDLSHPTSLEIEFCYPDWGEKSELALKRIASMFTEVLGLGKNEVKPENGEVGRPLKEDYSS